MDFLNSLTSNVEETFKGIVGVVVAIVALVGMVKIRFALAGSLAIGFGAAVVIWLISFDGLLTIAGLVNQEAEANGAAALVVTSTML